MLPKEFRAGSTLEITTTSGDYPAPDWTLTYQLRGSSSITITCGERGSDHYIKVPAATTAAYTPGDYSYVGYVVNDDGDRYDIESGVVTVLPNFAQISTVYDGRTHVKKMLDAIEAALEGRITADVESYQIGGRSISKIPTADLIRYRQQYRAWYQDELAAEKLKKGLPSGRKILTRL